MSLGPDFINLFEGVPLGYEEVALAAFVRSLLLRDDQNPPRTLWISRTATLTGSWSFPSQTTVAFAPGARLILEASAGVLIRGVLDAGIETRFSVAEGARVELLGPLDEIHADWWDDSSGVSRVSRALEVAWDRRAAGMPPIPIVLRGPYVLRKTLRVVPPAGLSGPVEVIFRGSHARRVDPPTFTAGGLTTDLGSLMSIEGAAVLTMEHVSFELPDPDAAGRAVASCLSFERDFDGSRVEACRFAFGAGAGVRTMPLAEQTREIAGTGLGALIAGPVIAAFIQQRATEPSQRLEIDRCVFVGRSDAGRAIDLGFGLPTMLALRNSVFEGAYGNAVSAVGGEVDVMACEFASAATLVQPDTADIVTRAVDAPAAVTNLAAPNTHLTVTHCSSTSVRFLVLDKSFQSTQAPSCGAVLTNVRHAPLSGTVSVIVGAGVPYRGVVLQGCEFGGDVMLPFGSKHHPGIVVDLGTRFPLQDGRRSGFVPPGTDSVVDLSDPLSR